MFVGHYAPALVAKRIAPEVPLWLLFIAVQVVDIAWAILVMTGIESVRIVPGFTNSNALDLHFMPYTHSLPATFIWSFGFALLAMILPSLRTKRALIVIALTVASHWLMDLIVHVPDLPLWGNQYKVGLGLWNHHGLALTLELFLLVAAGAWLMTGLENMRRRAALLVLLAVLFLSQIANAFGPVPQTPMEFALSGLLVFLLFPAISIWVDRGTRPSSRSKKVVTAKSSATP